MASNMVVLNDFVAQWAQTGADVQAAVERVGRSGWLVLGSEVQAFEAELAARSHATSCIGVANGLDALEIALRCVGVGPKDVVLTTPLSAFATTLAILKVGATPLFVDVDASGLLDLSVAERVLRSGRVKAFVPVHLYGHALHLSALERLAQQTGVTVIEDAAQALGASHDGKPVGSASVAWATSFYPTKNLGALGDGGALFTNDAALATRARSLRDYGQSAKYIHAEVGMNSRLDELQAAIMRTALLPHLDAATARRHVIATQYRAELKSSRFTVVPQPKGSASVNHLFPLLVPGGRREAFMKHLKDAQVASGIHYPRLINEQPALKGVPFLVEGALTQAQRFADEEVSLPMHPFMSDADVARVIAACNSF